MKKGVFIFEDELDEFQKLSELFTQRGWDVFPDVNLWKQIFAIPDVQSINNFVLDYLIKNHEHINLVILDILINTSRISEEEGKNGGIKLYHYIRNCRFDIQKERKDFSRLPIIINSQWLQDGHVQIGSAGDYTFGIPKSISKNNPELLVYTANHYYTGSVAAQSKSVDNMMMCMEDYLNHYIKNNLNGILRIISSQDAESKEKSFVSFFTDYFKDDSSRIEKFIEVLGKRLKENGMGLEENLSDKMFADTLERNLLRGRKDSFDRLVDALVESLEKKYGKKYDRDMVRDVVKRTLFYDIVPENLI